MTDNTVEYIVDNDTIEALKELNIDVIKEITDAIQNDADEHDEEVKIVRKTGN